MITKEEILTTPVRAISLKQPFAELMLHGKQETRTWATSYRGLVLICASVVPYADRELLQICGQRQYIRILERLGPTWFNTVKRGNAIAVGRLHACSYMAEGTDENDTFVKYKPSLFVHFYEDVTPIQPFPWRGSQGWKVLTDTEKKLIIPL